MTRRRFDDLTPKKRFDWTAAFLAALARNPNITAAAEAAGITRQNAYHHRNVDPEFAAAWDDALERSTDSLVGEAYRRAFEGTERPVFYQGSECGRIREHSDTLAIFLLKAHRPAVYGDRIKHDIFSTLSDEELIRRAAGLVAGIASPRPDGERS